ncbi:hypothetical protein J4G33_05865 [Actinotalea sp. BY-33]|uniref:Uncharacterized protein n=1 Tax=Actinotalea soli TaxID=2819234 RepID=A0A939LQT6_9CELL|nr:hypothetical protein [Actinotalea soli]MBO1751325.1 hypothetical protein [Actinotalea soli]
MDRPAVPSPGDEHWAPDLLVLARRTLTYAGRLLVELEPDGTVFQHSPLAGMAAVEQRYPSWAMGPFGRIEPEHALPAAAGVFALVQGGTVRYVGASTHLERTFGVRHGLGDISRRDCQQATAEERCRLNRLVVAEARAGRTVDLYVLATGRVSRWRRSTGEDPTLLAAELAEAAHGSWHLPR